MQQSQWEHGLGCRCGKLHFLLPHELLPILVGGDLESWVTLDKSVQQIETVKQNWMERVGLQDRSTDDLVAMSLWGDSAPFAKRDSLVMFLWSSISFTSTQNTNTLVRDQLFQTNSS